MTVLATLWNHDGRGDPRACREMLRAQAGNRGECSVGEFPGLALGSALGSEAGPLESASSAFSLIADARLDNRDDFLAGLGLSLREADHISDPRLMLLSIERWGTEVIDRFVGDFALILWDNRNHSLSLARDFAGQRPLHFHRGAGFLAVASMAKGIHSLDRVPRRIDETRMIELLAGRPHVGRRTCFEAIERVEPGELLTFDRNRQQARSLWNLPTGEIRLPSNRDYAEGLTELLDRAVAARLRGAGDTVGSHLSSGLDSSAVTTSAALQFPGQVVAFTSVPPVQPPSLPPGWFGNEAALAAATAAMHPNIEHRLIRAGERLALEGLGGEHAQFERPDLNLPNHDWTDRINQAASSAGIGTMLTGVTGNATISYRLPGSRLRSLQRLLPAPAVRAILGFRQRRHDPLRDGIINREAIARLPPAPDPGAPGSVAERLHMLRRVDFGTLIKGAELRWNVQMVDPTADRRLVEFCLRVPPGEYARSNVPRALARTALKGRIPELVRLETQRGLQAPHWFAMLTNARAEARDLLCEIERSDVAARLLDLPRMHHLIDHWPEPDDGPGPPIYRHGLLRGLSVGAFVAANSATNVAPPNRPG